MLNGTLVIAENLKDSLDVMLDKLDYNALNSLDFDLK